MISRDKDLEDTDTVTGVSFSSGGCAALSLSFKSLCIVQDVEVSFSSDFN